jgi:hypothetical protein
MSRLNTNAAGSSHSLAPVAALDRGGRVVVAWQDLRDIRPALYLNYSVDRGRTWQSRDLRVLPRDGVRYDQFPDLTTDGAGNWVLLWQAATDDNPRRRAYHLEFLRLETGCFGGDAPENQGCGLETSRDAAAEARATRLGERARAFWQAYVAGDYPAGYALMDPFFRARTNPLAFAAKLAQIDYLDFELLPGEMAIYENRARLPVKVVFESKQIQAGPEVQAIPRTETRLDEEWVWVDGDWYKVYRTYSGDFLPQL